MAGVVTDEELVARYPGEGIDHDNKDRYRGWLEHRLLFNRCRDCETWHDPPKPICPSCWSSNVAATEVTGAGTIFMCLFLHQGPPIEGVDYSTPHPVVTVELDEGVRFSSTVIDAERDLITIGARVTLDWIERGGSPLPVFRIAAGSGPT
jgi:uncharacterized OB-fold protein